MDLLTTTFISFITGGIGSSLISFWFKHAIEERSKKELESVKAEYQKVINREGQRDKVLVERQARVIARLYRLLSELHSMALESSKFLNPIEGEKWETLREKIAKRTTRFLDYFNRNRIYFPFSVEQEIEKTIGELGRILVSVSLKKTWIGAAPEGVPTASTYEEFQQLANTTFAQLRKQLENSFRGLTGVEP